MFNDYAIVPFSLCYTNLDALSVDQVINRIFTTLNGIIKGSLVSKVTYGVKM